MWIGLDGDEIVAAHLAEHRKVQNIRRDSTVELSVARRTSDAPRSSHVCISWDELRDCPMATFVLIPGAGADPRVYTATIARERLGLEVDEMAGGHLPMLSRPRELAERLVGLYVGE